MTVNLSLSKDELFT